MPRMNQRLWIAALLGAMALWFLPLQTYRLFNPDEGRYAEIPREMVASGDWVTPRLDTLRYFEKPPLQYWATAVAYRLWGEHEWTARLWVALTGFLGLLLTAWIGTRIYGPVAGALAALVQAGSMLYLALSRVSTLDMGLTVTLELALAGLLLLVAPPSADERARSRTGALLLAAGVALAFLSKGLVGILIPGAVAFIYMLLRREWSLLWRARPWWTLAALALFAAPWVWLVERRNPGFAQFFFMHEQFDRFLTRVHHRYQPDWYFIPVLLGGFMPWTPLLPAIVRRCWRDVRAGDPAALLLAIWVVFSFAFFSLSQSKLIPYILPLFPALALLAGRALAGIERTAIRRALTLSAVVGVALAVVVMALWFLPTPASSFIGSAGATARLFVVGLLLASLLTLVAAAQATRRGPLQAAALAAMATATLFTLLLPAAGHIPRQRELQQLVAVAAKHITAGTNIYCVDQYEQSVPFYLRRTCTLVGYRGELDFGLGQEPAKWVADLDGFASRWRAETDALALVRPESYLELHRMGLPMRVIYTAPTLVAVTRQ